MVSKYEHVGNYISNRVNIHGKRLWYINYSGFVLFVQFFYRMEIIVVRYID